MGKSLNFDYAILTGVLCQKPYTQVWSTASSSSFANTWVALHTADPTASGTQGANEANYTGYTRIAVSRTTAGWTVSSAAGTANPVSQISFPQATATATSTITYWSVGAGSATTGTDIWYSGTVSPNINISQNVTPILTTGSTISES